jgi:hypothetical protein
MKSCDDSEKRERNIQTRRVPNYLHSRLMEIKRRNHCRSVFDALLYCAELGLNVLDENSSINAISAQDRAVAARRVN